MKKEFSLRFAGAGGQGLILASVVVRELTGTAGRGAYGDLRDASDGL